MKRYVYDVIRYPITELMYLSANKLSSTINLKMKSYKQSTIFIMAAVSNATAIKRSWDRLAVLGEQCEGYDEFTG